MACNNLGLFALDTSASLNLCLSALTTTVYGDSLVIGQKMYINSGCTPGLVYPTIYLSNGSNLYSTNAGGQITGITGCTCSGTFCVQNDTTYDDTYEIAGTYNSQSYYTGESTGYVIYYSTGETRWCLSQSLGDPCDQFGPYGSTSSCPDLDDSVVYFGPCTTTTTTINPCSTLDLDAVFDCYVTPTPTITPSKTPTPTPTPTPSSSAICGGVSMVVSKLGITPTPTPSFTPTPTPTPEVDRPCNFSGEVIFNTFSEIIQCANSKKFRDCFTGIQYFTSDLVLVSGTTSPKEGYVYNAIINGQGYCVIYDGLFENISGVDTIQLITEIGSTTDGACLNCIPDLTQTPTPTPTLTPTPTPSSTPCVQFEYIIVNDSPSKISISYFSCENGPSSISMNPNTSIYLCSSTTPVSNNPQNTLITNTGFSC
jgi:hypothetical protein